MTTHSETASEEGCSITDAGASFWIQDGRHLAVAEISAIPTELATEYLNMTPFSDLQKEAISKIMTESKRCHFFNRLNVPEALQKQGHGRSLLKRVMDHMDQTDGFLINTASAYGARTQDDLIAYYQDSGMTLLAPEGLLGYHPKLAELGSLLDRQPNKNKSTRIK